LKLREKSGRVAVSEIHGSSLALVDTIAEGEATGRYVNRQARVTETNLGNNVVNTNIFLSERCSVAYFNFTVADNAVSIWLYHDSATVNLNTIAATVNDTAKTSLRVRGDASEVTDNLTSRDTKFSSSMMTGSNTLAFTLQNTGNISSAGSGYCTKIITDYANSVFSTLSHAE